MTTRLVLRARSRSALGFLVVALLAVLFATVLPTRSALAAGGTPKKGTTDPIGDLAACVRSTGVLEALFLFDTSGSLHDTDPDHRRAVAAGAALAALADLATNDGRSSSKVDVRMAQFSIDYVATTPWLSLNGDTLASVRSAADSAARPDDGADTDFANALAGARADLAERSGSVKGNDGAAACTAIFLFTDGKFDVEPRVNSYANTPGVPKAYAPDLRADGRSAADAVIDAGKRYVCNDKGVADVLRTDDVTLVAIALSSPGHEVSPEDQEFLRSVAVGSIGGSKCGDPAKARGAYLPAEDLGSLIGAFNAAASSIAGGTLVPGSESVRICTAQPCPEGTRTVTVSSVMNRATALVDLGRVNGSVVVRAPDGSSTTITSSSGPTRVGGALVSTRWFDPHVASIGVQFENHATSAGEWSISLVAERGGDAGRIQLFAYTDLHARLDGDPDLRIGQKRDLTVVVEGDGTDAATRLKGTTSNVTLTAYDSNSSDAIQIPLTAGSEGRWKGTWTVPDTWRPSQTTLTTRLSITTATGLELEPVITRAVVPVHPPASYPQISPSSLHPGSVEGRGTSKATITVTGGTAPGCVSFDQPNFTTLPSNAPTPVFSSPADGECVKVAAGETKQVPVSFKVTKSMAGPVRATLPIRLKSDDSPLQMTTEVPVAFETKHSVNGGLAVIWTIVLVILGIAVPIVLLYLLNYFTARFSDLDDLRGVRVRALVRPDGSIEGVDDEGHGTGVRPDVAINAWSNLGDAGTPKEFSWDGIAFRCVFPAFPFGEPYGVASTGMASLGDFGVGQKNRDAKIGLGLESSWIVTFDGEVTTDGVDENGDRLPNSILCTVVMFAHSGGETSRSSAFFADDRRRITSAAKKLAADVRALQPPPPDPTLVSAGSIVDDAPDDYVIDESNPWNL